MKNYLNEVVNQWYENKEKFEYEQGYNYAAGSLLRKEETPATLQAKIGFEKNHPFDKGIIAAINCLTNNICIFDDRV
jgi:hypothetical protein